MIKIILLMFCAGLHTHQNKLEIIKFNNIHITEEYKKKLENIWDQVKDTSSKDTTIIINKELNNFVVIGSDNDIKKMQEYTRAVDVRRQKIRLDFVLITSDEGYLFSYGINWSGIYNRLSTVQAQNKNFDFVGIGGQLTDIPTPTAPVNPSAGNLFVDPYLFAINSFTTAMTALQINGKFLDQALSLPIVFGGPDLNTRRLNILLNANDAESVIKIISRPSIVANNTETVRIFGGQSLPFYIYWIKSSQNSVTTMTFLDFEDAGTLFEIKPTILENNIINLDIYIEQVQVSSGQTNVSSNSVNPDPPQLETVKIKTNINVKDQQTIVIGGDIDTDSTKLTNEIPGIKKLPIVKKLFEGVGVQNKKQKRYIFVTAKIIND